MISVLNLLALVAAAAGSMWHTNAPLNTSLGLFQHEVTAVRDGSTLHLAWTEGFWPEMETQPSYYVNDTCAFSTSGDSGASWAPPTLHRHRGMIGVNPVVVAAGGLVYRVCMGVSDGSVTEFNVASMLELSTSGDGGVTWSPWRTIAGSEDGAYGPDKPWIITDGDDVYISFTDFTNHGAAKLGNGGVYYYEGDLTVIASHDRGVSFAAPVVLGVGQGSFITQAAAGGALFVSYAHRGVAQIAKSIDRGATFELLPPGPKWGDESMSSVGFPTLTYLRVQVDGGMALLASAAHTFGSPAVLYYRSAGGEWSNGTWLGRWSVLNAAMAVGTGSTVDFVWTECMGGTAQTFAVSSTDGGVTLQERTLVTYSYAASCFGVQYYGAYQGLVRDDLGALQVFYIHFGGANLREEKLWRAVLPSPTLV